MTTDGAWISTIKKKRLLEEVNFLESAFTWLSEQDEETQSRVVMYLDRCFRLDED